ncbi:transketolase family protein [Marinomonas ostreistagni]|uniref:transketolase family protein n=1 Tax=Marinomonas ostreistagni TaxID=359209 RepID=UPI00194E9846|nr:transketolase C-terminal domain-containing protein [Marinomonas ostreistagni]MBM6550361.1 transketolase family protein [Marinomonas ostreistagni]
MSKSEHLANVMVQCFIEAVEKGLDVVPVVADSTSTSKIKPFEEKFPQRLVNVGIAEQVMVGTAAGLALGGKIAVTCNAAPFLISRANEQVKVDVCYNNTNVKLFGLNAGASYGPLASTHHSTDDISVMRGFGNIEIYAPSCPIECRQIIEYALQKEGPVYVRMDGKALPELHDDSYTFAPGNVDRLVDGSDVALVAMGSTVHEAVAAAEQLAKQKISARVINLSSIRPLNNAALASQLEGVKQVLTVEEHNINGGAGSVVAEVMAEFGVPARLTRLGIADGQYAPAGDRPYTRKCLGIDSESIAQSVVSLINQ